MVEGRQGAVTQPAQEKRLYWAGVPVKLLKHSRIYARAFSFE
jgi:hypothetical protein